MPWVALAVPIAFLVVVFPVRAALRHRRDGEAGWADLRASRPRAWVAADVLFLTGMTLLVAGPLLEGLRILAGLATPGPATAALAVVLALAGLTLAVWAQETMGPAWRADIPPGRNARLVTRGPFAVVRNPNYVAMLGVGLATVSLAPWTPHDRRMGLPARLAAAHRPGGGTRAARALRRGVREVRRPRRSLPAGDRAPVRGALTSRAAGPGGVPGPATGPVGGSADALDVELATGAKAEP